MNSSRECSKNDFRNRGPVWAGLFLLLALATPAGAQAVNFANRVQVGLQYSVSAILMPDGTVKTWGPRLQGQLGLSTVFTATAPTTIPGLTNVAELALGIGHVLARLSNGTVKGWGNNGSGQIGIGGIAGPNSPTVVTGLTNVASLSCGEKHTLARHGPRRPRRGSTPNSGPRPADGLDEVSFVTPRNPCSTVSLRRIPACRSWTAAPERARLAVCRFCRHSAGLRARLSVWARRPRGH